MRAKGSAARCDGGLDARETPGKETMRPLVREVGGGSGVGGRRARGGGGRRGNESRTGPAAHGVPPDRGRHGGVGPPLGGLIECSRAIHRPNVSSWAGTSGATLPPAAEAGFRGTVVDDSAYFAKRRALPRRARSSLGDSFEAHSLPLHVPPDGRAAWSSREEHSMTRPDSTSRSIPSALRGLSEEASVRGILARLGTRADGRVDLRASTRRSGSTRRGDHGKIDSRSSPSGGAPAKRSTANGKGPHARESSASRAARRSGAGRGGGSRRLTPLRGALPCGEPPFPCQRSPRRTDVSRKEPRTDHLRPAAPAALSRGRSAGDRSRRRRRHAWPRPPGT